MVDGGGELQRCLYAFAVKTLLDGKIKIEAALLYPRAPKRASRRYFRCRRRRRARALAAAIAIRETQLRGGARVAGDRRQQRLQRFGVRVSRRRRLPARKTALFEAALGEAAKIWMAPWPPARRFPTMAARSGADRTPSFPAGRSRSGIGQDPIMAGRVVMLFARGVEPKRIAAITFTEFAASELMIRITRFVDELAKGKIPPDLEIAFPKGSSACRRTISSQRAVARPACLQHDPWLRAGADQALSGRSGHRSRRRDLDPRRPILRSRSIATPGSGTISPASSRTGRRPVRPRGRRPRYRLFTRHREFPPT